MWLRTVQVALLVLGLVALPSSVVLAEAPRFDRCKVAADVWFVLDGGTWHAEDSSTVAAGIEAQWAVLQSAVLPGFFPAMVAQEPSEKFAMTLHVANVVGEDDVRVVHSPTVSRDRDVEDLDLNPLLEAAQWVCAPGFEEAACNTTADWETLVREVHSEYYLENPELPFDDDGQVRGGDEQARCMVFLWMPPSTPVEVVNATAGQWFGWNVEGQWEGDNPTAAYIPECRVYSVSLLPTLADYPNATLSDWDGAFLFQESQNIWRVETNGTSNAFTKYHRLLHSWEDLGNGTGLLLGLLEDQYETGLSCWYVNNAGIVLAPWFALVAVFAAVSYVGYWYKYPSLPFPVEDVKRGSSDPADPAPPVASAPPINPAPSHGTSAAAAAAAAASSPVSDLPEKTGLTAGGGGGGGGAAGRSSSPLPPKTPRPPSTVSSSSASTDPSAPSDE